MNIRIRPAVSADIPVLRALIDASVRGLQTQDYTPSQIESALATVYGVDTQLIADGTYFVAEESSVGAGDSHAQPTAVAPLIVGCGGWSKRKTLYGGDQWTGREAALLDPEHDAAKIRAFFIHPSWARRGIGTHDPRGLRKRRRCRRFYPLRNGRNPHRSAALPGSRLCRAGESRSPAGQWRDSAHCPHGKANCQTGLGRVRRESTPPVLRASAHAPDETLARSPAPECVAKTSSDPTALPAMEAGAAWCCPGLFGSHCSARSVASAGWREWEMFFAAAPPRRSP